MINLTITGWGGWLAFFAAVLAFNMLLIMIAAKLWRTHDTRKDREDGQAGQ